MEATEIIGIYESWFTAFFGAGVGAVVGFLLSLLLMKIEKSKNVKTLESAFYNEFSILIGNLESWLKDLNREFENTIQDHYTKSAEYDFQYIDTLSLELIKQGKQLTNEQRKFIESIKWKFEAIKNKEDKREADINFKRNKACIPKHHTAYLLHDCVETIYYLKDFCSKKDKFIISDKSESTSKEWALFAYKSVGINFNDQLWNEVVKFNSPA